MRLKEVVLKLAKTTGVFALVRDSAWRRRRLLILCYHGVSMDDEHEWSPTLYVTQERLRERLRSLRDGGYTILPLSEATRRLYDDTLPPRSVALTFDDGAVDFERRALPVLREFNAPATLYLTTFYCVSRQPVFDTILSYVLWKGRSSSADVASLIASDAPLTVTSDAGRKKTRNALHGHAAREQMSAEEKNDLVARLARMLGVDYEAILDRGTLQIMTPETVRALPADLIDVQLHTHRHRTPRDHALFVREIRDNAKMIRELRGSENPLEQFCYPSGDYAGEFFDWLRECDVRYATTCVPDLASRESDPMLVPRFIDTMVMSDTVFEAWTSGFAALLPRKAEYQLDTSRLTTPSPRGPQP
ncbi:MAG: polysaccharide deacetylase family protein [Gemmatimonadaceae bacterium]